MPQMDEAFTRLAESHDEDPVLHIEARDIRARRKAGGVVWFDFKHPVRRPALAERLSGDRDAIPHRAAVRRAPDVCAQCVGGAPLHLAGGCAVRPARQADHVGGQVPPRQLYTEGPMAHEFPRTISRLNEMQSAEFLALDDGAW
jgi:cell division protein ZapE